MPAQGRLAKLIPAIQHQADHRPPRLARHLAHAPARLGLQVRGVGDRQSAHAHAPADDGVEDLEGRRGGVLIGFVVADERSATVGGYDLGRSEVLTSEGALPRARGRDEHHESVSRKLDDLHSTFWGSKTRSRR